MKLQQQQRRSRHKQQEQQQHGQSCEIVWKNFSVLRTEFPNRLI